MEVRSISKKKHLTSLAHLKFIIYPQHVSMCQMMNINWAALHSTSHKNILAVYFDKIY